MTDPYDQASDEAFDQIKQSYYRHPGGRVMTREPTSAEDKKAQAWQMLGCSSIITAVALAVAVVTIAFRL